MIGDGLIMKVRLHAFVVLVPAAQVSTVAVGTRSVCACR